MGRAKKLRSHRVKHAASVKKIIAPTKDPRLKSTKERLMKKEEKRKLEEEATNIEQTPASMFFAHNSALGPPFHVRHTLPPPVPANFAKRFLRPVRSSSIQTS